MYCNRKFHSNYHNHVPWGKLLWTDATFVWPLSSTSAADAAAVREIAKLYFSIQRNCAPYFVFILADDFINCSPQIPISLTGLCFTHFILEIINSGRMGGRRRTDSNWQPRKFCLTKQIIGSSSCGFRIIVLSVFHSFFVLFPWYPWRNIDTADQLHFSE